MPSQQSSVTLSLIISIVLYIVLYGILSSVPSIFTIGNIEITAIMLINSIFVGIIAIIAIYMNKTISQTDSPLLFAAVETIRTVRSQMTVFHWGVLILFLYVLYYVKTRK